MADGTNHWVWKMMNTKPGYNRWRRSMCRITTCRICLFMAFLATLAIIVSQSPCLAAEKGKDKDLPERFIEMAIEYPGVEIPRGDNVSMDVIFHNKGRSNEDVDIWIENIPEGWKARAKTYQYTVTRVHVKSDDDKTVQFEAKPEKTVKPGKYEFHVKGQTPDGRFKMAQTITVRVEEASKKIEDSGVKLTTSYPVLRGPSDAKFEFSMEVNSDLDKDAVFELSAKGPKDWEINFKPAYEDKHISSLRL